MPRPRFSDALLAFNTIRGDGSLDHVARTLGGKVQYNIEHKFFENACAIRMSYVLNKTGTPIGTFAGNTVSGADGARYIFRVSELQTFLEQKLGPPDMEMSPPDLASFAGKQGILVFKVDWANASGHATLWNGADCSDHCYFQEAGKARLWSLP